MTTPTYEAYLANPGKVMEQVERQARRERSDAVSQFILVPLKRLFRHAPVVQPRTA
jgi:hypothetical protein